MKPEGLWSWPPLVVLAAGGLFVFYLLAQVPGEIYFNGDGGVKAILARQFLAGYWGTDIRLPADDGVRGLWEEGFMPFGVPFVYEIDGRFVQCFPVFFPLLSAPFLALFGYRGLYVIPALALGLVWLRFHFLLWRLGLEVWLRALGLFLLIFASPLTLYGATFWEHTLAVALAFCGVAETIPLAGSAPPRGRLVLGGLLLGLGGWLRPENFCFAAAVLGAGLLLSLRGQRWKPWLSVAAGVAVPALGFVAINLSLYGHPLGAHSYSVLQPLSFGDHLRLEVWPLLGILNLDLILFTPVAFFVAIVALILLRNGTSRNTCLPYLLILLLNSLSVPLIVNHPGGLQWGPRYLLASVPVICLAAVLALHVLREQLAAFPSCYRLTVLLLLTLGVWGCAVNTATAARNLTRSYQTRTFPSLQFLRGRAERVVVCTSHYVPQELAAEWDHRVFLLATDAERSLLLAGKLHRLGVSQYLQVFRFSGSTVGIPPTLEHEGNGIRVSGRLLGRHGQEYVFYEMTVEHSP